MTIEFSDRDDEFREKLCTWLRGNTEAVRLCMDLLYVAHLWDDMIDKDKLRTDEDVNKAFVFTLYTIPSNTFYIKHAHLLQPQILSCCMQYMAANKLERTNHLGNMGCAYAMRNALLHVIGFCILVVGGPAWYNEVSLDFYSFLSERTVDEFTFFIKEMKDA